MTINQRILLLSTCVAALSTGLSAADPNFQRTTVFTIKPDRVNDFEAAVKDINALAKKANVSLPAFVAQSATGPEHYVLVNQSEKMSDLFPEGPPLELQAHMAELAPIIQRLTSCLEKTESIVLQIRRDLSMAVPATSTPPRLVLSSFVQVKPGKTEEWAALVKNEMLPAYRKAGVKSIGVNEARFGAPAGMFVMTAFSDKAADLEADPLLASMGPENLRKLIDKFLPLTESFRQHVFRVRADLSYIPQAAGGGAGAGR